MFPQHLISAGSVQSANLMRNKKSVEDDISAINQLISDFKEQGQEEGVEKYDERAKALAQELEKIQKLEDQFKQFEIEFSVFKYIPT